MSGCPPDLFLSFSRERHLHVRPPEGALCLRPRLQHGIVRGVEQAEGSAGAVRRRREDARPPHAPDGQMAEGRAQVLQVLPVHAGPRREEEEAEGQGGHRHRDQNGRREWWEFCGNARCWQKVLFGYFTGRVGVEDFDAKTSIKIKNSSITDHSVLFAAPLLVLRHNV